MISTLLRKYDAWEIVNLRKHLPFLGKRDMQSIPEILPTREKISIGGYLAKRLASVGVHHYFTVPGDFTLSLLDELLKEKSLSMVGCCNELNAGYAADGYARATKGLGVVVVTYMYDIIEDCLVTIQLSLTILI